jgi:hypothetical protein
VILDTECNMITGVKASIAQNLAQAIGGFIKLFEGDYLACRRHDDCWSTWCISSNRPRKHI